MKKITAFITAFVLFIGVAVSAHVITNKKLETNNADFGTWISTKKDLSYRAVTSNIEDDTVLMMGSSEFHHGNKTPYHPTNIFRDLNMNVMCIGAAQNQSLSHAITLGAIAPDMKNKKVVLIVSPSWFAKKGVDGSGFSARFSESMYEAFLKNDQLSDETKKAITQRTKQLLELSPGAQKRAETAEKVILDKNASLEEKVTFASSRWVTEEKENINIGLMWKLAGGKNNSQYKQGEQSLEPDWDKLAQEADQSIEGKTNNQFHMVDKLFKNKVEPTMKDQKDADLNRTYGDSPEYGDLRLFLDVCREQNMEVMLIMLPVNGWWYDYTGFPKENRQAFQTEVEKVAQEYGVKTCNFFDQCYTPGFLEDVVHPAGKGWVRINEEAYKFFKQDQKLDG